MVSNSKGKGFAGIPWTISVLAAHVISDLITNARCPQCKSQVVLYTCVNCKKVVRPVRGWATS